MSVHTPIIHVSGRQESPVTGRHVYVKIDIDSGTHRRPSVIAASASPAYPGRCPFVAGNPGPSVEVVIIPASVMKGRPTPGEVRYPGISIIGHCPVTVGCIRMKVSTHIGYPDAPIVVVVDPSAMRAQFIIEYVERYATSLILIAVVIVIFIISL